MAAKDGKTAFIVAALNGHEECAKLLTENGADWHAPHKPQHILRRRRTGLTAVRARVGGCAGRWRTVRVGRASTTRRRRTTRPSSPSSTPAGKANLPDLPPSKTCPALHYHVTEGCAWVVGVQVPEPVAVADCVAVDPDRHQVLVQRLNTLPAAQKQPPNKMERTL